MKCISLITVLIVAVQFGFAQTNVKNWEKALFATTRQGKEVYQTIVEFNDVTLTKTQEVKMGEAFNSKEEFIDHIFLEDKVLIIYHYSSMDNFVIKTFIIPVTDNFNIIKSIPITITDIQKIYSSL